MPIREFIRIRVFLSTTALLSFASCHDTMDSGPDPGIDLTSIPYDPVFYTAEIPEGFPGLEQPVTNPMTVDGIRLGRKLFYDPILSLDSTISCSSCHLPSLSFTDGKAVSDGVTGSTRRSSLNLIDVGFHYHGLFWDGRAVTLEEQSLKPIEDPIEMAESWDRVELKLRNHPDYPGEFRRAFGVPFTSGIDRYLAANALAQFLRSIISSGNSKYDRFVRGEVSLTENEHNGYLMFLGFVPLVKDAECGHCHSAPLFTTNEFFNNGIQQSADFVSFEDPGLGAITGNVTDNGLFKTPTLRNLAFTAPYMHDGRFKTLEEVIDHYNSGGQDSPNKHNHLHPLHLTDQEKSDLLAFLQTLTDSTTLTNPEYQSPF